MSTEQTFCNLCGEPMPTGEEMFKYHGYSGPCPKPPLPKEPAPDPAAELSRIRTLLDREKLAELLYSLDDSYLSKWSELAEKHYIRDRFRAAADKLKAYLLGEQSTEKERTK